MTVATAPFAEVLNAVREQTTHLLGTTISYDEDDWAQLTALSGWTRAHVAAHLVESAYALLALLENDRHMAEMTSAIRRLRLERGALAAGLQLQTRLDETAGRLQNAFTHLEDDTGELLVTQTWRLPANQLPLLRLREVLLHHYDLAGDQALCLSQMPFIDLLRLERDRPRTSALPAALLVTDEGYSTRIGDSDEPISTVIGPVRDLFLWLSRGVVSQDISGIDGSGNITGAAASPDPDPSSA